MIRAKRALRVTFAGAAVVGSLLASACSIETDLEAQDDGIPDEMQQEGTVLHKFYAKGVGEITIIDESAAGEEPSIGILLVSSDADTATLPIRHEDGADITALEYIATYDPKSLASINHRILDDHIAQAGTATLREVHAPLETVSVTQGSCNSWVNYFNNQANSLGGVGSPEHLLNKVTPNGWYYGNVGSYAHVVAGVCFVSQSDGNDNLGVRIERRLPSSGGWSTVPGTTRALNTSINGGYRRYVYKFSSYCSAYQRRIAVSGLPDGGLYPGDRFHLSGAWGGLSGCWLGRRRSVAPGFTGR